MDQPVKKILFVCVGNQCGSPIAEYLFKHILARSKKPKGQRDSYHEKCADEIEEALIKLNKKLAGLR